jgi:2-(1,2-epoxy-1,2-dihydrophenyl)acetyl-CoA isomerase
VSAIARFEYETIRVKQVGALAVVELHRPETLNAFNLTMARELHAALGSIAVDPALRAVVLTGAGRGFSSGLDLLDSGLPTLPSGRADARSSLLEVFNPLVLMLREMPQPVVAAVNGVAAGIGASFALACDLVLIARSATLVLAFVNVGLVPDGGSTVLVTARAGLGRALEMSLLGDPISAERALEWGLVNGVEADARLLSEAIALAGRLAAGPPQAQAAIKDLLNAPYLEQLKAQLSLEADAQGARVDSEEAAQAMNAFVESRLRRAGSGRRAGEGPRDLQ